MRNHRRAFGFLLSSLFGIGAGVFARTSAADTPPVARPRVTIRGTGNTISIERADAGAPRLLTRSTSRSSVLDTAVDMKEAGNADSALVGYLKAHAAELPGLVDFDAVARLRDAGAGRTVIAYLATVAAVEIGPTGAVGGARDEPSEIQSPAESAMSNELPAGLAYGVVLGGGSRGRMMHGHAGGRRGAIPLLRSRVSSPGVPAPMLRPQPRFLRR